MKKIFLLPLVLLISFSAFCQLSFENLSYSAAVEKSKQTGKLIFLQFESESCAQCNDVADKAFQDKKLSEQLEQIFICIKISPESPDRKELGSLFNKKEGNFGSLFISSDGTLLHTYPGSTTLAKTYFDHIDKALTKAGEGMRVTELEREFKNGNISPGLMELLLQTKSRLNLETDSLLEKYITLIPADSLNSVRTIQFIGSMCPIIDSKTDVTWRLNPNFNKAWYGMPLQRRILINRRIGYKSLQKAIREKNEKYAYRVASFIKYTYGNTQQQEGQKAFDIKMIDYYREIKDTLNYMVRSINYYDNYYMTVNVDSIKRKDSMNLKMLFAQQSPTPVNGTTPVRKTVSYSPMVQEYNRSLNNAAMSFYELTSEPIYLAKALQWSGRANQFWDNYASMDTHAHLLYKTGKKQEAIEWQTKAVNLYKKQGFDAKNLEKVLAEMKAGKEILSM